MFSIPLIFVINMMAIPMQMIQPVIAQTPLANNFVLKVKKYDVPGEKSIVIVSTKCPTEYVGIPTPSSKAFHYLVDSGMSCINKTQILPIELRQACS